jgi:hypothetical protein
VLTRQKMTYDKITQNMTQRYETKQINKLNIRQLKNLCEETLSGIPENEIDERIKSLSTIEVIMKDLAVPLVAEEGGGFEESFFHSQSYIGIQANISGYKVDINNRNKNHERLKDGRYRVFATSDQLYEENKSLFEKALRIKRNAYWTNKHSDTELRIKNRNVRLESNDGYQLDFIHFRFTNQPVVESILERKLQTHTPDEISEACEKGIYLKYNIAAGW